MAYYSSKWKLDRRYKGNRELAEDLGCIKKIFKLLWLPLKWIFMMPLYLCFIWPYKIIKYFISK